MTTQPSDWAVAPKFCEWLRGIYASERNPYRDGMYVRTIRRTGRCNPGTYFELTDGKGNFWQYPRDSVIRLDRARELDASGGAPKPIAWMDNHGEVIGADVLEAYRQAHGNGPASCYHIPLYATPRAAEAGDALDAARWRFFAAAFDKPMEREWLRRGFGLPPCDFSPTITSAVDAAIDALGD